MVPAVKTTAWGRKHGSLALVLEDADYRRLSRDQSATTYRLDPPTETVVSVTIDFTSTPFEIMNFKEAQKRRQKAYDIQERVTNIGVERIFASANKQYLKELNGD